jgi:putative ABC transport system permease protein
LDADYQGLTPIPFQRWLTGDVRLILLAIFAAAGVLLLIACSNLASLILARLAGREREVAVRLALGSSRMRLMKQFLTENLLLATVGGAGGFFLALWALPLVLDWIPFHLPAAAPIRLDMSALIFTFVVALSAGALLSLVPCLSSLRSDIHEELKNGGRTSGNSLSRHWTGTALVTGQIALSVVLLVSAMLLSESLYLLSHQDLGFDPNRLITFRVDANSADVPLFRNSLLERFKSLPGVQSVATVNKLPLDGPNNYPTQHYGHPEHSIGGMEIRVVTPEYFAAMGIPIRAGRNFGARDDSSAPPVIAVSENVARRWWPEGDPLGDLVIIGVLEGKPFPKGSTPDSPRAVVGIVGDTKSLDIRGRPRPTVYIPYSQATSYDSNNWLVRGDLPRNFAEELRAASAQVDPRFRFQNLHTMNDVIGSITADSRFEAMLSGMFAGTAVLMASIGIFGLLSFSVVQRTREIGTRIALGASRGQVLRLILKQGFAMLTVGVVVGIGGALGLTRFLSVLLFGIKANNALSYFSATILLLLVGLIASYLPAHRAMKIDPMTALRNE